MTKDLEMDKTLQLFFHKIKRQGCRYLTGGRRIVVLCFAIAFFLAQPVFATGEDGIETSYFSILAGSPLVSSSSPLAVGAAATLTYAPEYEQSKKIKNIVTLGLFEEIPENIPGDFSASVRVRIEYKALSSAPTVNTVEHLLVVDYKKGEGVAYNAKNYFTFSGAEYVKVTVLEINAPMLSSFDSKKTLIVQNEMRVTRFYELKSGVLPSSISSAPPAGSADELPVSWQWPADAGNTHTQLEWTWLENELEAEYKVNGVLDHNRLFKNNATRIDLPRGQNAYKIPLLYGGAGKLYFRIRAVNIKKLGTRNDGPWSAVQAQPFLGHNDLLNWQSTISFAEEGKRKAVVQYYDGTLRSRQTVTKENVTNTTITSETLYDGQGRPAVQILPAPGITNVIAYTKNLNLFNGQLPNEDPAKYFDLQPKASPNSLTPSLSPGSGTARYYSASNPEINYGVNKYIPDAEGYPYTITRYTPDATGRIMAQSGVGASMKMGSGHETKYYYGTPSQEELDGLFGTEVGNYTHYFKNMVKDANGQMSVSYVDMHGRTIATALAGDAPSNLVPLDLSATHYPNQGGTTITRNLHGENANAVKNNSIESINTLLVPATTLYQFRYELNPQSLQLTSCNNTQLCYDCMYNLEISITDESGDAPPIVKKFNNVKLNADDNCTTAISSFENDTTHAVSNLIQFSQTLAPGSYTIRKTLTVSEASLQKYKEEYGGIIGKGLCATEQQIIDSVYQAMLSVSECDDPPSSLTDCQECLNNLGDLASYRQAYLSSLNITSASPQLEAEILSNYTTAKLHCDRLCNTTSQTLATKRSLMLSDMVPYSGQYATEAAPSGGVLMYNQYNIFSTSYSGQPFYKNPWNSSKNLDYYYNALGVKDGAIHPDGTRQLLANTGKEDFVQQLSYSWAEALLPHHPEYDRLVFAEQNLTASYNWINTFLNTKTYSQAASNGYIFTSEASLTDPFYSVSSTNKGTMANWVTRDYRHGLSMWQIAYGDARCKNIPGPLQRKACYENAPETPPFSGLTTAELDQVWNTFKSLYAAERDNFVNQYIATSVPLPNAATLVQEGYLLHFPADNQQLAEQLGDDWSWFPSTPGGEPNLNDLPYGATAAETYSSRCSSYINLWRQSLEQCPSLATHPAKEQILNEITSGMVAVCEKGSNDANPYGASTVAPNTPYDGSPRSFEEVINNVFSKPEYQISRTDLCNPFVIEFPKPFGKNPSFTKEMVTVLDTCNCNRFSQLKSEAVAAGKNPSVLSSLNQYLLSAYGDTLTLGLFDAMTQNCSRLGTIGCVDSIQRIQVNSSDPVPCDCERVVINNISYNDCTKRVCDSTGATLVLTVPQPMPAFMKCGFVAAGKCLDCAQLSQLTAEFKTQFSAPYNAGPIFSGTDLDSTAISRNILFTRFVNFRTGFQFTWMDYAKAAGEAGCNLASYATNGNAHQNVICRDQFPLVDTTGVFVTESPCQKVYDMATALGQQIYQQRRQALRAEFEAAYRAKCLAAKDSFTVTYSSKEYHFTLYYYDMAGHLVKTVPPKGVRPDFSAAFLTQVKTAKANNTVKTPAHQLATNYRYNSLGQVVAQNSPDGGTSKFWYDKLGRLAVSQNAQQALDGKYSYTLYDDLGRITEVGQKPQTTLMTQVISQDPVALNSWINTNGGTKEQITFTVYDLPYPPLLSTYMTQQNLRNRVSYTGTKALATDALHYTASFYTYDIHGNVDTLLQDYKGVAEMDGSSNRFKLIAYDYDLVSGKVNRVQYQPGKPDAFYHRYYYDAENRVTSVETSRDEIVWERDAAYAYYKHGPLARTELGQLRVQGLDYAYTLQGWLKGVNSTNLSTATDMGKDGLTTGNSKVARDVVGFALHYFDAVEGGNTWMDYKPITGAAASPFARPGSGSGFVSLYNGNIGGISINNAGLQKGGASTNALPLFYRYRYDQLNRLVTMQAYKGLDAAANGWNAISIDDYKEAITYDPNGNILTYNRKGAPTLGKQLEMDALTYNYLANSNKLGHIADAAVSTNYTEDIDAQASGNYTYDAIGNLKKDIQAGIGTATTNGIFWNVYGKITSIVKTDGTIAYTYDAAGNRISKTAAGKTTVYVRDASGNVMSVYEAPAGTASLKQIETHLYGSSRLGLVGELTAQPVEVSLASGFDPAKVKVFTRGEKIFELSNHLGNVLATISDKKIGIAGSGGGVDYYSADVRSASDYAPFGMQLVGRKWNGGTYRYGFNGKENDNDVKGEGNQQDYGFRIYDPRLGKFLSVDPLTKSYPWYTPYQFAGNKPIWAIDLDGLEEYYATDGKFLSRTGPKQEVFTADRIELQIVDCGDGTKGMEKVAINAKSLNTTPSKFKKMAATVYAESSVGYGIENEKEVFAIASVHMRNKIAFGESALLAKKFLKTEAEKRNGTFMQTATAAVINALNGGFDYSYGARQWDGAEQSHVDGDEFSNGKFLFKVNVMGWKISSDHFESWKKLISKRFGDDYFTAPQEKYAVGDYKKYRNKDKIRLTSTAQYGLTIFWKEVSISKPKDEPDQTKPQTEPN